MKKVNPPGKSIRKRAEEKLKKEKFKIDRGIGEMDSLKLLHELQVHQIVPVSVSGILTWIRKK